MTGQIQYYYEKNLFVVASNMSRQRFKHRSS